MKKIFFYIILLIFIISNSNTITNAEKDTSSFSFESKYELYQERVSNICNQYLYVNKNIKGKKIRLIIDIKSKQPKMISEKEMNSLIGPLNKKLNEKRKEKEKKVQTAIKKRENYIKENSLSENSLTPISNSSWIRNPNLSSSQNQASYEEYLNSRKQEKDERINELDGSNVLNVQNKNSEINNIQKEINSITKDKATGYSIKDVKKTHRKNMNDIYKCGLLNVQKKSLLLIKKDLIKQNASISKKIAGKIYNKLSKLKYSLKALKCNDSKEKSSIIKLNILSQTTYETCKYVSYLEYLKEYNLEFNNVLPKGKNKFTTLEIPNIQKEKINALNKEIDHTYKVFPLAFNAYSEYENNITIHLLLQLIRDDYIVLREKLHKALNPINQVVYKIANVMTK